jgi:hypothetical protein
MRRPVAFAMGPLEHGAVCTDNRGESAGRMHGRRGAEQ